MIVRWNRFDFIEAAADHVGQDHAGLGIEFSDIAEVGRSLFVERAAKLLKQVTVDDVLHVERVDFARDRVGLALEFLIFGYNFEGR